MLLVSDIWLLSLCTSDNQFKSFNVYEKSRDCGTTDYPLELALPLAITALIGKVKYSTVLEE